MKKRRTKSEEAQAVLAEAEREGIDLSLLHERLRLTPTERLEHNRRFLRFVLVSEKPEPRHGANAKCSI